MTQNELAVALGHHQRGQLSEAAQGYQAVLASQPDHPDALHLLGVLAHQLGNHSRAVALIGRAVALRPGVAAYHGNLAEAYRALGQLDLAEACCRTALSLRPDCPEALNGLALVFLARNQPHAALAPLREALRLAPGHALAWNNLGNALRLLGQTDEALAHFRRATELEPALAEAHSNLGQLLLERKQLDEALPHCQEAVRLRPRFAAAHSNLGNVLREMNRLEEARACYAEALRLAPGLAMVANNMGQAFQEEGTLDEAVAWYGRALEREPGSARFHANLASVLAERQQWSEAAERYELALRFSPAHAEALNGLGWVRHEQGDLDAARALYERAVRHAPELSAAHCNLAALEEEMGDLSAAEGRLREALRLDGRLAGAWAQLGTMLRGKLPDADLAGMRELLTDPYLTEGQRAGLRFGLAAVLDGRGEHAEAAEHLEKANAVAVVEMARCGKAYDPAAHTRLVEEMMATFRPGLFDRARGWGVDSERPIFVVGLPRSGTTLTEQVLAAHSQVFGAGELPLGRESFEALGAGSASPFEALGRLDAERVRRVADRHLGRVEGLGGARPRVVDKMPDNHLYLGLLAVLFPRARFIHCRRDLRDTAVSCWMTNFRHLRWASDPEHIAARFRDHQRLTEHWRRVLPVGVLEIDYGETVADLEGVARRLVSWCGLEWEPACLNFHEGKRLVRTASVAQVREPVYQRSVARWKHYEQALGGLFARLGGPA